MSLLTPEVVFCYVSGADAEENGRQQLHNEPLSMDQVIATQTRYFAIHIGGMPVSEIKALHLENGTEEGLVLDMADVFTGIMLRSPIMRPMFSVPTNGHVIGWVDIKTPNFERVILERMASLKIDTRSPTFSPTHPIMIHYMKLWTPSDEEYHDEIPEDAAPIALFGLIKGDLLGNYATRCKAPQFLWHTEIGCENCQKLSRFDDPEPPTRCGHCRRLVKYCSKQCQELHWEEHKKVCDKQSANE